MAYAQICTKCILKSGTPGISFDKEGVCNYCATYSPMKVIGERALLEILDRYRNRNNKYDCMVCISGGRDSIFTLWKLVHDYKMRVLAVNYRNPFTAKQAQLNMERATRILKVDFQDWEFPEDIHRRATAKTLRAWAHHPTSALIPIVCQHCKTIWPTLYQIARSHKTPLIVIGSNPLETASFKRASLGGARYYHKLTNLPRLVAKSLIELTKNPRYLTSCSWRTLANMYLTAGHNSLYLQWRFKDSKVVRLFDYLRWNEKEVLSTITKNLAWKKSDEVASSWRFDCRLDYVRRQMYTATVGVTELRDLFSKMIRENMVSRDDALARLEKEDAIRDSLADNVLAEIGITMADLNLPR